jgi:hypothetical protein
MPPRHFWWLCETLEEGTKRKGLDDDTRAQLQRLLDNAVKGKG